MLPREIFLSHSSLDKKQSADLASVLRKHGLNVWYSDSSIRNAQQWHDEIGKALKRCDWFVILLSKHSVDSKWVKMELMYALRKKQYKDHILPVLLRKCDYEELSWTLDTFQMVDCKGEIRKKYAKILSTWGIGYKGK